MNSLARRTLLLIVLGGGSILTVAWAHAQEPAQSSEPKPQASEEAVPAQAEAVPDDAPPMTPSPPGFGGSFGQHGRHGFGVGHMGMGMGNGSFPHPMGPEHMEAFRDLRKAVVKLKNAKNDADKTSATNEISKLLEKSFQKDLEWREKQVSEIEARVKKLRDQIDKRKKAKDEIVSLRLKTIVNEAEGLGFPGGFGHGGHFEFDGPPGAIGFPAAGPQLQAVPLGVPLGDAPPTSD